MNDQSVFSKMNEEFGNQKKSENGGADYYNPGAFSELVKARRSIREFTNEKIPDEVVSECLDMALLAPNSSNLQTWEFYRIKTESLKKEIVHASFSQPAAATAAELIVCVIRPDKWRAHSLQMLEYFKTQPKTPKSVIDYYSKIIPFFYTVGFFSILAPFKWILNRIIGLMRPVPREPISSFGLEIKAAKSCALACENLMLAFRAHGFDTCPMEGFDSVRVKKAMKLHRKAELVMIIGAGRRAEGGLYGPRVRFAREQFVKTL